MNKEKIIWIIVLLFGLLLIGRTALSEHGMGTVYVKGIEVNSKSYFLYSQLAFLDNEMQNYTDAIENANRALSLKRNYGPALIALATANVYLCNMVAAEDAFKRARSYDRRQVSQLQEWAAEHNKTICK